MRRPCRAAALALVLSPLLALREAHAVDLPRPTPPPDSVDVSEPHRISPIVQGVVGAVAGVALISGIGVLADSYSRYAVDIAGGDGNSCRPCSSGQLSTMRGEYYAGITLLAVGGALAVVAGALVGVDVRYRNERADKRASRVTLTPMGLRF